MKSTLFAAFSMMMFGTVAARAQDTNQQMIQAAQQMRDLANQMEGEQAAELRRTADAMEASAREEMAATALPNPAANAPGTAVMAGKGENWLATKQSCAGFTVDNYRTFQFPSDGDEQLRTMCAAAYNYWAMYERALATGYTVETARPTWEAYNKAALVADEFYESTKSP